MRLRKSLIAAAVCAALLGTAGMASAQVSISIRIAPPVLPVYTQPPIPASGYLWVPGYWAWNDEGYYYWVPGTWVLPPEPGLLWTPGYWGWSDGVYLWHEGYWGARVGFYGGIDYGFGYGPNGYDGGYWRGGQFYYNSAVNRIPPTVRLPHVYRHEMDQHDRGERVAFNGGEGVHRDPTAAQLAAEHEHHVMPIASQRELAQSASHDRQLRADYNHGHPGVAATPRPSAFHGGGGGIGGEAAHAPAHEQRSEGGAPAAVERGPGPARSHQPNHPEQGAAGQPAREPAAPEPTREPDRGSAVTPGAGPGPQPHMSGNAHAGPAFTAHEHVPSGPRAEPHAAPVHPAAPHPGEAHPQAQHGGGQGGGHRQEHPPGH